MLLTKVSSLFFSSFEEIFCEMLTFSAKGRSTILRPANEISAVSRDPFVEIGSLTIWAIIICPGESTFSIRPSFSRGTPISILEYTLPAFVLLFVFLTNSSNALKYKPKSK